MNNEEDLFQNQFGKKVSL